MRHFTDAHSMGPVQQAVQAALRIKAAPFAHQHLGKNRTALLIFFNNSLRTRLSTQKAAMNLGMNVMVLDVNQGAWRLETRHGVIMDGDRSEHLLEAIPVMGGYADIIGVRSFAQFESKASDYSEEILSQFIRHSGKPVFSMECATGHPLQALADMMTIAEHTPVQRPRVVLTWAPHPKALPQAVPNSFAQWAVAAGYDVVVANPPGYDLDPRFTTGASLTHNQDQALQGAHFVYAKNWSAYADPNYGQILTKDPSWTITDRKMALTHNAYFMHCLPCRRGMIVSDSVIEGPRSLVIPQAANREFAAQAVLERLLADNYPQPHENSL